MSDPRMNICPPQLPHPGQYNDQEVFCDERLSATTQAKAPGIHRAGFGYEAWQNTTLPIDDPAKSYYYPHSHDPGLLMARPLLADQRLLYMPPEQESVAHQLVNHDYNAYFNNTIAPPFLDPSSATGTLRLPPRNTVHHTMNLYGEVVPQEDFFIPS